MFQTTSAIYALYLHLHALLIEYQQQIYTKIVNIYLAAKKYNFFQCVTTFSKSNLPQEGKKKHIVITT
jgi:hypothetical protein